MKKITPVIAATLTALLPLIPSKTKAQDFFIQGDLVSSYIWRGMKSGGISLQPSFGFTYKGLSIYTWASTSFQKEKNELDIYLDYEYKNLKLSFADFFTQGRTTNWTTSTTARATHATSMTPGWNTHCAAVFRSS